MRINWNIVNRTGQASDELVTTLRPKISKLEKLLTHFPEDAVHLQIILDTRTSDKTYQVGLNLRVPSDVLHVGSESKNLVGAVDDAVKTLVRRLKRLKARYRRDHAWKHRSSKPMPERAAVFTDIPLHERDGPQTHADAVVEVLKKDYERLLGFVARQLNEHVLSGTISKGAIEPSDIVDRVAERVLGDPDSKPASMDYRTWCSSLAFQQTRDAIRRYSEEMAIHVSVDLDAGPEPAPAGEDDMEPEEFALNLLQRQLEPDELTLADTIPDAHIEPPDSQVVKNELLSSLSEISRQWPKVERETFQLHFMEGLSIDDVAHAFACDREAVETTVSNLRARLRTVLSDITGGHETVEVPPEKVKAYASHLNRVAGDAADSELGGGDC